MREGMGKYRGKDIKTGEWLHGSLVVHTDGRCAIVMAGEGMRIIDASEVDPETVGEFAGESDQKGVDIYEGDIYISDFDQDLYDKHTRPYLDKHIVKHGDYAAGGLDYYSSPACGFYGDPMIDTGDTEAIDGFCTLAGNIHDNPELNV